ncbi:MAG: hypothetical protein MJZ17_08530 [Bacteroidales bacterium]|nr:hypothetical protein [Bacteroidales bacterium]
MQNIRIYPTTVKPVIFSRRQIDETVESFKKEDIEMRIYSPIDTVPRLWRCISQRIAERIDANMELSESAGAIADAILSECPGLRVLQLEDSIYEVYSERTGAKIWMVENESGEIFLYFLPILKSSDIMTARDRQLQLNATGQQCVDITEMGPETAAFYISEVFAAFQEIRGNIM